MILASNFSGKLTYFFGIIFLFSSIYIPRYTRVSTLRQKTCHEIKHGSDVRILYTPDVIGNQMVYAGGDYRYYFSRQQNPVLGESYHVIGTIKDASQCVRSEQIALTVQSIQHIQQESSSDFYLPRFVWERGMIALSKYQLQYERKLSRFLTPQQLEIVEGMFLGKRPSQVHSVDTLFRDVGLIHILVASGANIALIAGFTQSVMRKIYSRNTSIKLAFIVVLLYAVIVGWQAPIMRALCMYTAVMVSQLIGRRTHTILVLTQACLFLLIIQPLLLYSASFYLTVLSTLGMVLSQEVDAPAKIRGEIRTSLIVSVFTTPLLMYLFGKISLIGVILTVLTAWLVPLITNIAMVLFFASSILPLTVFSLLTLPLWFLCEIFIRFINLFSGPWMLQISIDTVTFLEVMLLYFFIGIGTFIALAVRKNER